MKIYLLENFVLRLDYLKCPSKIPTHFRRCHLIRYRVDMPLKLREKLKKKKIVFYFL